jgi:AraC-like DNA-binding protein
MPDRPWTLRDLGHRVGLSRSVFSARFSKVVGQPMQRYLIARRMDEAAFLLEATEDEIAQIAKRVGYETTAAFSKMFNRYHGRSPGLYRTTHRSADRQRQPRLLEAELAE